MPSTRLIASALAACLLATPVFAQNTTDPSAPSPQSGDARAPSTPMSSGQTGPATGIGSMGPSTASSYRPITPSPSMNIIAELQASGQFTILLKALTATNLASLVQAHTPLTLLAPTDAAFNALPPSQLATLMAPASAAQLQALLTYHLINARVSASDVQGHAAGPVPTVATKPVIFDGSTPTLKINDANVLQVAVPASNGVIYVIDKVLTPPS